MMTPRQQEKHDMIMALQASRLRTHLADPEHAGFIAEAAMDFGLTVNLDAEPPTVAGTLEQLVRFALAGEAAGHFQYARRAGHNLQQALAILNNREGK